MLLLHLLPDGVDGLGASFHVELQSGFFETFFDRLDEAFDIGVACLLGGVQFLLDEVVGVVFQILHAEVFQLALQFV